MARIPLYNQGRGSSIQKAVGSLSPEASVGAFTAPGQALSSLANSAQQIAFDFGIAERRKKDEDIIQSTNLKFVEDSTNWIRENPTDNTQEFKDNYKNWQESWVKKNTKGLDSRRKRLVENRLNKSISLQNLQGQQKAYSLGEFNQTKQTNQELDKLLDIQQNYPKDSAEYIAAEIDKNLIFDNNKLYGRSYKYNQYTYDLTVTKGNFLKRTDGIASADSFGKYRKEVENNKQLSSSEKSALITVGETKFKENKNKQIRGIIDTLVQAKTSTGTFIAATNSITRGLNKFVYTEGTETKEIDISNLDSEGRESLRTSLSIAANNEQSVELRENVISLNEFFRKNPSLATIKEKRKAIENNTGEYTDISLDVRTKLLSDMDDKIAKKTQINKIKLDSGTKTLQQIIATDGEINEKSSKIIEDLKQTALSIDDTPEKVVANEFINRISGTEAGLSAFKEIIFADSSVITKTINDVSRKAVAETNINEKIKLINKRDMLTKLVLARQQNIKKDPYTYFQKELNKISETPVTSEEILEAQRDAGVPFADQRLISVEEENNFIKSFKATMNMDDKLNFYNNFINQEVDGVPRFTIDNKNQIIRNMVRRGSIDLRDNIFISDPSNLVAQDLYVSSDEKVKKQISGLPKSERDDLITKTRSKLASYSESVIGQSSTDYDYAPEGATQARVGHIADMQNIATDLAGYYYLTGASTIDAAVKKATDNLINNKFNFITPGEANGVVRLPVEFESIAEPKDFASVLDAVLANNDENKEIFNSLNIKTPAGDLGNYQKELFLNGRFVTKSDNSGVILVDQTGNPVMIGKQGPQTFEYTPFTIDFSEMTEAIDHMKNASGPIRSKQIFVQNLLKDKY